MRKLSFKRTGLVATLVGVCLATSPFFAAHAADKPDNKAEKSMKRPATVAAPTSLPVANDNPPGSSPADSGEARPGGATGAAPTYTPPPAAAPRPAAAMAATNAPDEAPSNLEKSLNATINSALNYGIVGAVLSVLSLILLLVVGGLTFKKVQALADRLKITEDLAKNPEPPKELAPFKQSTQAALKKLTDDIEALKRAAQAQEQMAERRPQDNGYMDRRSTSSVLSGLSPASAPMPLPRIPDLAISSTSQDPLDRPFPPRPQVSIEAALRAVLTAVKELAVANTSLTARTAATRVLQILHDDTVRSHLSTGSFAIDFFDAGGQSSLQTPELMAIKLDDTPRLFVIPFPQAGRVARFVNWFGSNDYKFNPVLADRPAVATISSSGTLEMQRPGSLAKA